MLYLLFLQSLKQQWRWLAVLVLAGIFGALLISFWYPAEYRTETQLLIVQKQQGGFDPYLSIKASERLAEEFSYIIYTSSFIDKVQQSGFRLPKDFFISDAEEQRKDWKDRVKVKTEVESGIITIFAYHTDAKISSMLAGAIAEVLVTKASEYHGGGDGISLKVIDDPLTGKQPVRPNLPLNIASGVFIGVFFSILLAFFLASEQALREFSLPESVVSKYDNEKAVDKNQALVSKYADTSINEGIDEATEESLETEEQPVFERNLAIMEQKRQSQMRTVSTPLIPLNDE
jgi:capsular polysaccharide biosynthesis protein